MIASELMAVKSAVDLLHVPSRVRLVRAAPLPRGMVTLLRIAAGDEEAVGTAALALDRSAEVVRRGATFFIEQILFEREADSYRVLGAHAQASAGELRRNVALLMRWLHPDRDPHGERSIFVRRVTAAWNDVKTTERRAGLSHMGIESRTNPNHFWNNRGGEMLRFPVCSAKCDSPGAARRI